MEFCIALIFAFFGAAFAELLAGSAHLNKEEHGKHAVNHAAKIHGELSEDKICEFFVLLSRFCCKKHRQNSGCLPQSCRKKYFLNGMKIFWKTRCYHVIIKRRWTHFFILFLIINVLDERLLEAKRLEQKGSVKYLIGLKDPEKQISALKKLLSNIKDTITASKAKIDSNKNPTDIRQLFFDLNLRDDVCTIVENTAFFAEFTVYFPDYVEKFFSKNNKFKAVYEWAYNFSKALNFYEDATNELMKIAGQELRLLPRPNDYVNVNRINVQRERATLEAMEEMRRAKEEMKRRTASDSKQKRRKESKHNEL